MKHSLSHEWDFITTCFFLLSSALTLLHVATGIPCDGRLVYAVSLAVPAGLVFIHKVATLWNL